MRKITILEVLDPVKNEFVPIRQAINQGLFNTKTYLFFNPVDNQHYSITEAARRGLFKSAIDLRPEALIVERTKVAQTVSLLSARDPTDKRVLLSIQEAIKLGIVDTNMRIYRNTATNQIVELSDAIDSDLIQVKVVRETTEKITETLTEQKNPDNLGIIKKIETSSSNTNFSSSSNYDSIDNESSSDNENESTGLKQINGYYIFDRTKSLSINKTMRKYDDDIAAGFITDSNTNKIIKPDSKSLNPVIDFNDALSKNLIILPDSLCLTQNVQYVIDLNTGNKFDYEAACEIGLIDVKNRNFFDTKANKTISLFEALSKNYIVMKDELATNYDEHNLDDETTNKSSQRIIEKIDYRDLKSMFNPLTGEQVSISKAIELFIFNKNLNIYVDLVSGKSMSLENAVERGLAVLKPEKVQHKINEGYQFLHIRGIFNPVTKKEMSLSDAINAGFLDYSECEFHDPSTGKTLTLLDAYDKGYLITSAKQVEPDLDSNVKSTNNEKQSSPPLPNSLKERKSRKTIDLDEELNAKLDKKVEENISRIPVQETPIRKENNQLESKPNDKQQPQKKMIKSQSISPQRTKTNAKSSNLRASSSFDMKSLDKLSMASKKSAITKIKEKVLGKKTRSNRFDEELIKRSLKIIDTKTKKPYILEEAIKRDLLFPDDRVRDTLEGKDYSINEAISKGIIKFYHPINNFEFKYNQSCSIFNDEYLLLVNYVIDPTTHNKIGLKTAFTKQIIDKDNCVFYKKKPINLADAIEKGNLSCEIIEMNLLNSIITSNIFKHHVKNDLNGPTVQEEISNKQIQSKSSFQKSDSSYKTASEDVDDLDDNLTESKLDKPLENTSKTIDETDNDKTISDLKGSISTSILKDSGIDYDKTKRYVISEVYDSDKDKFIKLKKASFIGIINLDKMEYVDSKTGNVLNLAQAIRRNKIKIEENKTVEALDTTEDLELLSSSNYEDLDSTIENLKDTTKKSDSKLDDSGDFTVSDSKVLTSTLRNSTTYDSVAPVTSESEQIPSPKISLSEPLSYDSFTNSLNSKINGNYSSKSSNISEVADNTFNLIKCLLYKKPSNGKYIRFERVVKNKLFDSKTGKIKDLNTNEDISVNEALFRGVLRINDANTFFDENKIYVIDTVLYNSRKIKLADALEKNIIDKVKCCYKFLNTNYSIKEAMKQGYIEGKIITAFEIKWLLEDFANKIEAKIDLKSSPKPVSPMIENDKQIDDDEVTLTKSITEHLYTPIKKEIKKKIESFTEFYIFDGSSESYISMNDAFYNGIILNEPVRIKDPSTNNYILLKDAVIRGLISCEKSNEKVDFKKRSSFLTHNRTSYLIDGIYEPRKRTRYSLQEANKSGIFVNGIYRNFTKGETYNIDEAISKGLIVGKKVDLDDIESSFKNSLGDRYTLSSTKPPSKPTRGVYIEENEDNDANKANKKQVRSRSKSSEKRRKFASEDSITKSQIEPYSAKIVFVQDLVSGKYVKPDEAERFGLINFLNDTFKNSLTNQVMKISEAMEKGYILVESSVKTQLDHKKRTTSEKTLSKPRVPSLHNMEEDDLLNSSRVEMGQQFDIISVSDPIKKKHLDLDEAINTGLFDVESAMYVDPRTKKRITLVDAIDQGLIKIADETFKPSYKLVIEENDRNFVKNIKTLSIRFAVNSFTQQVIPINVAVTKKLVNLDNGTYIGNEKVLNFKEAYDKFLVFTGDDLDNPNSKRAKFRVAVVRKSTTGKNMSLKSALAKNWLNLDRRIYIDKQTNLDMPFSQAVDMDLLVLRPSQDDVSKIDNSRVNRSKSKDSFL